MLKETDQALYSSFSQKWCFGVWEKMQSETTVSSRLSQGGAVAYVQDRSWGRARGPRKSSVEISFASMLLRSLDIAQNLGFENMRCTILLHVWSHIRSSARILVNKKRARVLHVFNFADTCINQIFTGMVLIWTVSKHNYVGGRGPCEPLKAFVSRMLRSLDIVQNHSLEHILGKGEMELGLREYVVCNTLPSLDSHPVVGLNSSEQKTCKRLAIARSKRRIQHLDCVPGGHCTSISSCSEWSLKQRSDLFALRNPIEAKHIKEWKLLQLEWNLIATLKRNFHIPPHGMGVV